MAITIGRVGGWGDSGLQILQHGVPKTLLRQIFGEPLFQFGIARNLIRGFRCHF
jgi:hypothetical protein